MKIMMLIIAGHRKVEVIYTGRHKVTSPESIHIYTYAANPGGRPCCDGTVL